jgi:adenosylcobinamide kinase / adenosylcobinamide-phosphate guanylyltransferase
MQSPTPGATPEHRGDLSRAALIVGSAARTWPVPGCGCVACRSRQPATDAALRVGDVRLAAGRLETPEGTRELRAGERYEPGGVRVVALPGARPQLPALVLGLGERTLLWSEGPGDLPDVSLDALADAGLAGAALDLRGSAGLPDPLHLAHTIARLTAVRALAPGCDVVAIGRTHELHPGVLAKRLAHWGARVAPDGTEFGAGHGTLAPTPQRRSARTLVLGPASSGKSAVAEDLLAAEPEVVYAATGPAPDEQDPSWADRVAAHRARRPPWWATDESGELIRLLAEPGPPLLVDALGTWVAAAMDRTRAWEDAPGWRVRVEGEVDAVVATWRQARRPVVAVGEEVGWGVVPADPGVAAFREVLGSLLRRLAAESEHVLLVVAGRVVEFT